MDYEKKYKEALEVAKRKLCFGKAGMVDSFTPNDIYEMFPELKESEDEKIRKWLISQLKIKSDDTNSDLNIMINKAIFWLEKQGIQPRYNIGDVICDKSCTTLNKEAQPNMEIVDIQNGMYICDKGSFPVSQQDEYELVGKKIDTKLNDDSVSNELRAASVKHAEKELKNHTFPDNEEFELVYTFEEGAKWNAAQKHNWSDEDENIKEWIMSDINKLLALNRKSFVIADKEIIWLKSLKDRVGCEANCTTTKEWSEEDKYMAEKLLGWLNTLINYIQGDATVSLDLYRERERQVETIKTWLKSLKALNTWKPSDEQMEVLLSEVTAWKKGCSKQIVLESLYNDLKKLK